MRTWKDVWSPIHTNNQQQQWARDGDISENEKDLATDLEIRARILDEGSEVESY